MLQKAVALEGMQARVWPKVALRGREKLANLPLSMPFSRPVPPAHLRGAGGEHLAESAGVLGEGVDGVISHAAKAQTGTVVVRIILLRNVNRPSSTDAGVRTVFVKQSNGTAFA